MRETPLQNLAEAMGWMAYLAVVGGGLFERELFGLRADDDGEAYDEPARVLQLDEYREARRLRSVDDSDDAEEADESNVA